MLSVLSQNSCVAILTPSDDLRRWGPWEVVCPVGIAFLSGRVHYQGNPRPFHCMGTQWRVPSPRHAVFAFCCLPRLHILQLFCCCCCCSVTIRLCDTIDCSMPGSPVLQHLPEFYSCRAWALELMQSVIAACGLSCPATCGLRLREVTQWPQFI